MKLKVQHIKDESRKILCNPVLILCFRQCKKYEKLVTSRLMLQWCITLRFASLTQANYLVLV